MHCLPKSRWAMFKKWAKRFVDWKWQYLERYLDALLPLLPLMILHFDPVIILAVRSDEFDKQNPLKTQVINRIHKHLMKRTLLGVLLLLRAAAKATDRMASWCEGCRCHEWLLHQAGKTRHRCLVEYQTKSENCIWKGCGGAWLARGAATRMVKDIAKCCDHDSGYQSYFTTCAGTDGADVKKMEERLIPRICQLLTAKIV